MPIPEWVVWVIMLSVIILPIAYLFLIVNGLSEILFARKIQSEIDKVLVSAFSTYSRNKKYDQCCYELELILTRLANKSSVLSKKYESVFVLIECFLVDLERGKISCDLDKETFKEAIFGFIEIYKNNNPLEQINGANYSVLKELLETEKYETKLQLANQMAVELKSRDDLILGLQLKNRTSTTLSVVGIVLTVVFGIIALI